MNLTGDNSGLGGWTEESLVRAMRAGRHLEEPAAPSIPLPWTAPRTLSDADLVTIFADGE